MKKIDFSTGYRSEEIDSFERMQDLMNEYFETKHYAEDRMILPWQIVVETGLDPDDKTQGTRRGVLEV